MKTTEAPVVVEQTFHCTPEKVWNALTRLDEMILWFFPNIPAFDAVVGFETQFTVESGERTFPHLWKILEIVPRQRMVQEWQYPGYDGLAHIIFELQPMHTETKVTVTAKVLKDFPDDIPEFKRESCVGGWEYFIQQQLKNYLES